MLDLPAWTERDGANFVFFDAHTGFAQGELAYPYETTVCETFGNAMHVVNTRGQRFRCQNYDRDNFIISPTSVAISDAGSVPDPFQTPGTQLALADVRRFLYFQPHIFLGAVALRGGAMHCYGLCDMLFLMTISNKLHVPHLQEPPRPIRVFYRGKCGALTFNWKPEDQRTNVGKLMRKVGHLSTT